MEILINRNAKDPYILIREDNNRTIIKVKDVSSFESFQDMGTTRYITITLKSGYTMNFSMVREQDAEDIASLIFEGIDD